MAEETLIQKIRSLPPERVAEVEDFVDFLTVRDQERQLHAGGHAFVRGSVPRRLGKLRRCRIRPAITSATSF